MSNHFPKTREIYNLKHPQQIINSRDTPKFSFII